MPLDMLCDSCHKGCAMKRSEKWAFRSRALHAPADGPRSSQKLGKGLMALRHFCASCVSMRELGDAELGDALACLCQGQSTEPQRCLTQSGYVIVPAY